MSEDIYKMKLHEVIRISDNTTVIRVAGGWIYETEYIDTGALSSVFVPFNNEFMDKDIKENKE